MISKPLTGSNLNSYAIWLNSGQFSAGTGNASAFRNLYSSVTAIPDTWYHVAFTVAGTSSSLYLNGALAASSTSAPDLYFDPPASARPLLIGAENEGNNTPVFFMNGMIDEVAIYDRALSVAEIAATYSARGNGMIKEKQTGTGTDVRTELSGVEISFAGVSVSGMTRQTGLNASQYPDLPSGHEFTGLAYDLSSGAVYQDGQTGDLHAAFHIPGLVDRPFANLRALHLEGGVWVDRTDPDSTANSLQTTGLPSLGAFILTESVPQIPVISSAATASAIVSQAFSYQITAANGPVSFGADGLPNGLVIDTATGLISGTPTSIGSSPVTLSATNVAGTGTGILTLLVTFPSEPIIWPTSQGGNGHSYEAVHVPAGIDWPSAEAEAVSRGGHLASIGSQEENNVIHDLVKDRPELWTSPDHVNNIMGPWLGGYGIGSQDFAWTDGSAFQYSNWAPGEPDGVTGDEARIHFLGQAAQRASTWNDYPPEPDGILQPRPMSYIIEWSVAIPNINSAATAAVAANQAFTYQITATNHPTSFAASGLPSGFSLDASSGVITGTPIATGYHTVMLSASNSDGTGTATLAIAVTGSPATTMFKGYQNSGIHYRRYAFTDWDTPLFGGGVQPDSSLFGAAAPGHRVDGHVILEADGTGYCTVIESTGSYAVRPDFAVGARHSVAIQTSYWFNTGSGTVQSDKRFDKGPGFYNFVDGQVSSGVEEWRRAKFGDAYGDPDVSGLSADPNGNGLSNLLEYALGLDPMATGSVDSVRGGVVAIGVDKFQSLTFTRPTGAQQAPDVVWTPLRSSNLESGWSAENLTLHTISPGPGALETLVFRSLVPMNEQVREFLKLGVTLQD